MYDAGDALVVPKMTKEEHIADIRWMNKTRIVCLSHAGVVSRSRDAKTVVVARDAFARLQYEKGVFVNVILLCCVPDFHGNSWFARKWTKHVRMVFFCVSVYIVGQM